MKMASVGEVDTVIANSHLTFNDLFTCHVCKEHSVQPYYLSCGDIVCEKCLTSCVLDCSGSASALHCDEEEYFDCPVCHSKNVAHRSKLAALDLSTFTNLNLGSEVEPNDAVNETVQGAEATHRSTFIRPHSDKKICSICQTSTSSQEVSALNQCLDCLDFLCKDCSAVHQKTKFTRNHVLASISDVASGSIEVEKKRRYKLACEIHPDKFMTVYCLQCGQMLCLQCKLINHNLHICSDLSPAASTQRQKLVSNQTLLSYHIDSVEDLLVKCHQRQMNAKRQQAQLINKIADRVAFFKQQLDIYTDQLTSHTDKHFNEYFELSDEIEKDLKGQLSRLVSLRLLSERLLENATDVQLLASKHQYGEKINKSCQVDTLSCLPDLQELHLNIPNTQNLAIGFLFGQLTEKPSKEEKYCTNKNELAGVPPRYCGDDGALSYISPSGRIYDAEPIINTEKMKRPVSRSDFKDCVNYLDKQRSMSINLPIQSLIIGTPSRIFSKPCLPGTASVVKVAAMSMDELVVATFDRNYNFDQTRSCTRVRLQIHKVGGEVKVDVAYGAVIYGLAVSKDNQIVVSGGEYGQRNIDVFNNKLTQSRSFQTRCVAGGVGVDSQNILVVAGAKNIEFYSLNGELIHWFADGDANAGLKHSDKGFEHMRKELTLSSTDEIFISDPNTNNIRGYNKKGELLLQYGGYGRDIAPVINPRGIAIDQFDNILACDLLTHSIHIISKTSCVLQCKVLEGKLSGPRAIACYGHCHIAVGENSGMLQGFQYMFNRNTTD